MFNGWIVFAACLGVMGSVFVMQLASKREWPWLERASMWVGLIGSLYCVATGLYLVADWEDPFANVSGQEIAKHTHARGSGFIVLVIRIWPYFLIGMGGWFAWQQAVILRRMYRRPA